MAREACIILEAVSVEQASAIEDVLAKGGFDIEREAEFVWCFVGRKYRRRRRKRLRATRRRVLRSLRAARLAEPLARDPEIRVWSEDDYRYVDSGRPDLDDDDWHVSDLEPTDVDDISYVVEVVPASAFDQRATIRALRRFQRPILQEESLTQEPASPPAQPSWGSASDRGECLELLAKRAPGNYARSRED